MTFITYELFMKKIEEKELFITISNINIYTKTFKLYQNKDEIGVIDISIKKLSDHEKEHVIEKYKKKFFNYYSYNIDYIEIYKNKTNFKGIGTCFFKYCIDYLKNLKNLKNLENTYNINFSTLDNCIDSNSDIYFYKKLGYEWLYFDYIQNKPDGPEMIKIL